MSAAFTHTRVLYDTLYLKIAYPGWIYSSLNNNLNNEGEYPKQANWNSIRYSKITLEDSTMDKPQTQKYACNKFPDAPLAAPETSFFLLLRDSAEGIIEHPPEIPVDAPKVYRPSWISLQTS